MREALRETAGRQWLDVLVGFIRVSPRGAIGEKWYQRGRTNEGIYRSSGTR